MGTMMGRRALLLLLAAVAVTASPALAHSGAGVAGGFASGFSHPLGGLDHMLAMVAVGIWGAFLGRPLIWALPVAFPLIMVVGGVAGIMNMPLPYVETGIAASVIGLGLAIALAWRAPAAAAVAVVSVFALFHGYAHGKELPEAAAPEAFAAGFVVATGLLHLAGIGLGLLIGMRGGGTILRFAGGAIALTGVWLIAGAPGLA